MPRSVHTQHAEGGCGFHLENLRERGVISKIVPIHADAIHEGELEVEGRQTHLMKAWVQAPMSVFACQPLDEIRDYLGERIALYFAFVETLSNALVYQAALGLLLMFISLVWYGGSHDNPFTALYSLAILLWITWFCKRWRRMEIRLASHWHVTDFEETERHRPDFQGPEEHGFYSDEGYWVEVRRVHCAASTAPRDTAPLAPLRRGSLDPPSWPAPAMPRPPLLLLLLPRTSRAAAVALRGVGRYPRTSRCEARRP